MKTSRSLHKQSSVDTSRKRRWRAQKKAQAKAAQKDARQTKRIEVQRELGILPLAIADITDAHLAPASVDAIITDPPYAERDLPLYAELAHLAARTLKPSGWCLVMVGDLYLDQIIVSMVSAKLKWRGLIGGHRRRPHSQTQTSLRSGAES